MNAGMKDSLIASPPARFAIGSEPCPRIPECSEILSPAPVLAFATASSNGPMRFTPARAVVVAASNKKAVQKNGLQKSNCILKMFL
jgi:hypothetical protein